MNIFLVDEDPGVLQRMAVAVQGLGPVRCVAPEDAPPLVAAARGAVVCFGPNHAGGGLVSGIAAAAPESVRLALTARTDLGAVQELLHEGGVSGVYAWPAELDRLASGVGVALARVARRERVGRALDGFRQELSGVCALAGIASATAGVLFEVLEGVPVLVQLWDQEGLAADGLQVSAEAGTHWVESALGGEMSTRLHTRALHDGERSVGEIVVDLDSGSDDAGEVGSRGRERTLALLEQVAVPAALAAGAQIRQREADRGLHALMVALAGLAGCREYDGARHVERLAQYVRLLAVGLREDGHFGDELTDEGIEDIVRAVPLHDIGKLAIPDAILLKPGRLSSEERRVVETHAETGARALEVALQAGVAPRFLHLAREAARGHHEKWDGSGYPRGLLGEHIPLVARLLALADIYDAVTTRRPYRAAWGHDQALDLLFELSGTHLDPRVVGSFLAREAAADALRERLRDDEPMQELSWVG